MFSKIVPPTLNWVGERLFLEIFQLKSRRKNEATQYKKMEEKRNHPIQKDGGKMKPS